MPLDGANSCWFYKNLKKYQRIEDSTYVTEQ